jgi:hypothetical protein
LLTLARSLRRFRLSAILFLAALSGTNGSKAEQEAIKIWPSPDGGAKVIWERIGPMNGDTEQYALTLIRPGAEPARLEAFRREVDLIWSADSKTIVFTDYIGSDIADCYVVDANRPDKRVDIADLVPDLRKLADAHVYVTCEGWKSPNEVNVHVFGRRDGEDEKFDYRYVYDLPTNRLRRLTESGGSDKASPQ